MECKSGGFVAFILLLITMLVFSSLIGRKLITIEKKLDEIVEILMIEK